ncbi:porin family protein [Frigidibacter sp. ROC022]|uniref:porin family protein n=1 Tax=Frigidibacter sp. ROC022 TaxID=2971796 RepID=UPI00215A8BB4|nr:porin family protein [Frigidibacter sp. ROC022]MCR8725543.1 porin family protein [Frigidibacter sp. ROC022]
MSKAEKAMRMIGSSSVVLASAAGFAHAQDVDGFYGGVGVAMTSGDAEGNGGAFYGTYSLSGGALGSAFAGYNVVSGSGLVFGGEIAVTQGGSIEVGGFYSASSVSMGPMIDLKARVGKVFGSTLVYGALGYSLGSIEDYYGGGEKIAKLGGVSLGGGFETPISENGFIGGDVTMRKLKPQGDNDYGEPSENYIDSVDSTTISVRIGFRF